MQNPANQLDLTRCAECACFNIRKASRAVTALFDGILQPSGVRGTQFALLVVLSLGGPTTITRMGQMLSMDRTTLTRNLKPLLKQGLITIDSGTDQRTRVVTLTAAGRDALSKAFPLWQRAQAQVVGRLGPDRWRSLLSDFSAMVALSR